MLHADQTCSSPTPRTPRCANELILASPHARLIVNGKTYFRLAWEHRHALSLFGTAPRARVRPNHSSPIDPVHHQYAFNLATERISFPILGSRCRDAFLFLFQATDAGHLVYITVQFPQH